MSKKVIKLVTPAKPAANPVAVEYLQNALKSAKKGEIVDVFIVGVRPDGYSRQAWNKPPDSNRVFRMLGAIETAKIDFRKSEIED